MPIINHPPGGLSFDSVPAGSTLAADIGRALGCGAHLIALRRLQSGVFGVGNAVDGSLLQEQIAARQALLAKVLSVDEVLAFLPRQE